MSASGQSVLGLRLCQVGSRLVGANHRYTTAAELTDPYEELIAEETQAAEQAMIGGLSGRPGFVDGAMATLAWAWRRSGAPPIEVEQAHVG